MFWISLTVSPGHTEAGNQTTNDTADNDNAIGFPTGGVTGATLFGFGLGSASSAAGNLFLIGDLTATLAVSSGITPSFAAGALAGPSVMQFLNTGTLGAVGDLAGAAQASFDPTGTIITADAGAIFGTTAFGFTLFGTLSFILHDLRTKIEYERDLLHTNLDFDLPATPSDNAMDF